MTDIVNTWLEQAKQIGNTSIILYEDEMENLKELKKNFNIKESSEDGIKCYIISKKEK